MHLPVAGTTADADRGCFARLGQYLLEAVVVARFPTAERPQLHPLTRGRGFYEKLECCPSSTGHNGASVFARVGVFLILRDDGIQVTLGGGLNVDQHDNLLVGDQGSLVIDIFKQGATTPFRQITTAPNYPYQFAFSHDERHVYLVSGQPAAVYVYAYGSGKLLWTDTQGLSPSGYALGVAVRPAAPL
jgi:DNA-binding beta-propeller fold protein YncE